jgi:CRISPR/Cas system-associated protein Cas10 (large subunit of type III CRISPR-Cas system)
MGSRRTTQKFDLQRFYSRKLNGAEVKGKYSVKISNRCAALENLDDSADSIRDRENVRENIKMSAKGAYVITS